MEGRCIQVRGSRTVAVAALVLATAVGAPAVAAGDGGIPFVAHPHAHVVSIADPTGPPAVQVEPAPQDGMNGQELLIRQISIWTAVAVAITLALLAAFHGRLRRWFASRQ